MKWRTLSSCQRCPEHGEVSILGSFVVGETKPGIGGRLTNRVSAPVVPYAEHAGTSEAQRGSKTFPTTGAEDAFDALNPSWMPRGPGEVLLQRPSRIDPSATLSVPGVLLCPRSALRVAVKLQDLAFARSVRDSAGQQSIHAFLGGQPLSALLRVECKPSAQGFGTALPGRGLPSALK